MHAITAILPIDHIEFLVHLALEEGHHPLSAQPIPQRVRLTRAAHVLRHRLIAVVQRLAPVAAEARRNVQHLARIRFHQVRIENAPLAPHIRLVAVIRQRRQCCNDRHNVARPERVHQLLEVALHVGEIGAMQQIDGANVDDDVLVDGRQQTVDLCGGRANRLARDAQTRALDASAVGGRRSGLQLVEGQRQEEIVAEQLIVVHVGGRMVAERAAHATRCGTVQGGVRAAARRETRLAQVVAIRAELVVVLEIARAGRAVERFAMQRRLLVRLIVLRGWRLVALASLLER